MMAKTSPQLKKKNGKKAVKSMKEKVDNRLKIDVYDKNARSLRKIDLNKEIFDVKVNHNTLYEVYNAYRANKRQVHSNTKTRSEVTGGSSKPWRQKGTGRARHGTIRSPLWRGGAIVFGPRKEKNYKKSITKSKREKALKMVLSAKLREKEVVVLDSLDLKLKKTKEAVFMLDKFNKVFKERGSILVSFPDHKILDIRTYRNIPHTGITMINSLNAAQILDFKYIFLDSKGLRQLEDRLINK